MKRIWTCLALLVFTLAFAVSASAKDISTAEDVLKLMNKQDGYSWSDTYTLTKDIDLSTYSGTLKQKPIGNSSTKFTGTFDGQDFEISGIRITGTADYTGFFGWTQNATIKNLTISGTVSSTYGSTAGLVGYVHTSGTGSTGNTGVIENCVNKCTVTGANYVAGIGGQVRNTYANKLNFIDCKNEGKITGTKGVGGIVGFNNGHGSGSMTIAGCVNTGEITATTTSGEAYAGGILGVANGPASAESQSLAAVTAGATITECKNSGNVTGYFKVGGIAGSMEDDAVATTRNFHITKCMNSGTIKSTRPKKQTAQVAHTGGIVGLVDYMGSIRDCLNIGVVQSTAPRVGGIIGEAIDSSNMGYCLSTTTIISESTGGYVNSVGGFLPTKPTLPNYYTQTLQGTEWTGSNGVKIKKYDPAADFAALNTNGNWVIADSPELKCFHTHDFVNNTTFADNGDGTHTAACACGEPKPNATPASHDFGTTGVCVCGVAIDLSVITTAEQLLILMNAPSLWTNGDYTLGNDIDLTTYTGTLGQQPIGNATTPFTGSFDGQTYTISGLAIDESGNNVGFFGVIGAATVKNLTIEGSVKGGSFVGGIVGLVGSTSKGVTATIDNCHNKATVSGAGKVGGVVGYFHGYDFETASIKNCSNSGTVTATAEDVGGVAGILWEVSAEKLTNTAEISSTAGKVGGVIGRATGNLDLSELKNSAKITAGGNATGGVIGMLMNTPGTTLSASENSGAVTTSGNAAGGIVGDIQLRSSAADNAAIDTCVNRGKIVAEAEYAGGITGLLHESAGMTVAVGTNNALTVEKCENYGNILTKRYGGGIIGAFRGADTKDTNAPKFVLAECQSNATVTTTTENGSNGAGADAGGIAGLLYGVGDVSNCRSTGTVHGAVQYVGGFVGRMVYNVSIANCYADCYVTCDQEDAGYVRGFCGYPNAKKMNDCYYNADKCSAEAANEEDFNAAGGSTPKAYSRLVFNALNGDGKWVAMTSPELVLFHTEHDNTQGGIDNGDGTHTPICPCGDESTVGTTISHEYDGSGLCACGSVVTLASAISTADQLVTLMRYSNLWDGDYVLTANINLSGKTQSPIGNATTPFTGNFDGQGYTVSGLNISTAEYAGLFGKVAGTVEQPVEIRNLTVSGTVKASGNYAGGIVAYAGMRDSSNSAVVFENCYNKCTVSGKQYVGGIVGYFYGSDTATNRRADNVLAHCFNAGAVTATGEGGTENRADVGGIAGILWGVGDVNNCYATGKVTAGGKNAGGLIGRTYSYTVIRNCYVNAKVVASAEGFVNLQAFCGAPDYTFGYTDCYYNPKTMTDENATLVREYDASSFDGLNADGLWLQVATPELLAFHTKHNNKLGLAWVDLGEAGHAPICPCGNEDSIGTTVAHTYDANKVCTVCGNADLCKHIKKETYIDGTPNCQTDVLSWERCAACHTKLTADGEETVIAASAEYHNFEWVVEGDTTVCKCITDGCGAVATNVSAPETFTELYVSSAGYPFGGFSKEAPLNDYDMAMQIAATQDNAVVIYVLDRIAIPFPTGANSEYVYLEPAHTNTITVCGTEESRGVLYFGNADREMIYGLNGPTTFENIEFSFGNVSEYLFLTARHNPLVLGEGVSTDIHRVNDSDGKHTGLIYVIGGCYKQHFAGECEGKRTDVTICSGTYRTIIGGHYSGKNCGNTGEISLKLLGDVTTRNQICAGNVGVASGKVTLTIDGNLSIGTFFTFGSQTAKKCASETVVVVNGGSVVLNSFYANLTSPMSPLTIGSVDQNHNVLAYTEKLTVYTDENSASAMALRKTILASVFSAPDQLVDFKDKVTFLLKGEDAFCAATGGSHIADDNAPTVTDSTCTVQGYETYVCSACTEEYNVALPLAAHNYDAGAKITIAATCIAPEMEREVCTACGSVKHTITGNAFVDHTDPEKTGFCQGCNKDLTADCEHTFGEAVFFKSGCGDGTKRTCSKCGKVEVEVFGDGHNYGKYVVTVEPTATMAGIKTRTCKGCGKVDTALLYATDALNASAVATDADGNLADFAIENAKLTKGEKAALNALLQQDAYGSEVKISYETDGKAITNITYSIPVPAEYTEYKNVRIVVRDDDGKIHFVDFQIEKGYIVFTF